MANNFFQKSKHTSARFKPLGKWDEAVRLLGRLNPEIKAAALRAQELIATDILNHVRWHLISQDLPWRPLKKKYKTAKRQRGLDTRMLISHGTYYESIEVWKRANGWQYFVGVKKGKFGKTLDGKKSKIDISTVAIIQEFGRNRRPLWNPTIMEMGGTRGIKELYLNKFEAQLRRRKGLSKYIKRLRRI